VMAAFCCVFVSAKHVDLPEPYKDDCIVARGVSLYNSTHQNDVPWFNVNLDLPPSQRWVEIATAYRSQITALIQTLKNFILPLVPNGLDYADIVFGELHTRLPQPYKDEISSISQATGLPLGEVVLYNVFYEIFTVCTSIVAQDHNGNLVHARNLDFGLFLGWDPMAHEWSVSQQLRQMVVNINWMRNGQLLYKSNNFAGFIGIYNGLKPNAFSVTANERFMAEGGIFGMMQWLTGTMPDGKWMTWLTRECMETSTDYASAMHQLSTTPMLSPVYYIVGGNRPYQGAIITRSLNATDSLVEMDSSRPDQWYVLETNYDPGEEVLFVDDRDTPGRNCMRALTQRRVDFEGIYNVLSSRTTLNKLTAYTVLMDVNTGRFETHIQACPGACWPF